MPTRIEEHWGALRTETTGAQRRVDATHPLDLYADFEHPDKPGLMLICQTRPPEVASLKAIGIECRQRHDGRWSIRILLLEPKLLSVFAELCHDIIEFTRDGVDPSRAGGVVLSRIDRWRSLMQAQPGGLSRSELRGLIGELLVLETRLIPTLGEDEAVRAWTGPLGTAQDFRLPDGQKVEVKALDRDADQVHINGLGQLDGYGDPLLLAAVRLEETGHDAVDAITASLLVNRIRVKLAESPAALHSFEALLRFAGWDDSADTNDVVVRMIRIDIHDVEGNFPRLTAATVPAGVADASYVIVLPSLEVAVP